LGLVTIDHVDPSHSSTNVAVTEPVDELPTATQLVKLAHATPRRTLEDTPVGLGLDTIDHIVPSHRSTNVAVTEPVDELPTATQLVALAHATPPIVVPVAPAGTGIDTNDHLDPSQRCAINPTPANDVPTATQLVALAHATPYKEPRCGPGGLGLSCTDHAALAPTGEAPTTTNTPATSPTETMTRTNEDRRRARRDRCAAMASRRTPTPPPNSRD
jgi:hypothetical protein